MLRLGLLAAIFPKIMTNSLCTPHFDFRSNDSERIISTEMFGFSEEQKTDAHNFTFASVAEDARNSSRLARIPPSRPWIGVVVGITPAAPTPAAETGKFSPVN